MYQTNTQSYETNVLFPKSRHQLVCDLCVLFHHFLYIIYWEKVKYDSFFKLINIKQLCIYNGPKELLITFYYSSP